MWLVTADRNIAMSCLRKVGSVSMQNIIKHKEIEDNKSVLDVKQRVFWVRKPIDRLISCYSFFHHLNNTDGNGVRVLSAENTASWESFIDTILSSKDPHWNPQAEQLKIDNKPIWTIAHKFEDIIKKWGDYLPGLLPWYNACTHLDISDYRRGEIESLYREDAELWRLL